MIGGRIVTDRRLSLTLGSDLSEIVRASSSVATFLAEIGVVEAAAYSAHLVFEEITSNIIRHGLTGTDDREIRVEVRTAPGEIVLTFADDGPPFDPCEHVDPAFPQDPAEREPGGLGILLVRKAASSMRYRRENDQNLLEVRIAV
jgi:anti-sigma regulatory factor (Ser/Thr protein kinase)